MELAQGNLHFSTTPIMGQQLPVEAMKDLNKTLDERYQINDAYLEQVESQLNQLQVEERNQGILDERKMTTLQGIKDIRSGSLESAGKNIKALVSNLSNDEMLKGAMYSNQLKQKADAELDAAYKKYLEGGKDKTGIDAKMYMDAKRNNKFYNTKTLQRDKDGNIINYFQADAVPNKQEIEDEIFEKYKGLKVNDIEFQQLNDKIVNTSNNPTLVNEWRRMVVAADATGHVDISKVTGISKETLTELAMNIFKTDKIQNYINWKAKSSLIETLGLFDERGEPIVDAMGNSQFKQVNVIDANKLLKGAENIPHNLLVNFGIGEFVNKTRDIKNKDGKITKEQYTEYDINHFINNNIKSTTHPSGINQESVRDLYTKMYKISYLQDAIEFGNTFSYGNMAQKALYNHISAENRKLSQLKTLLVDDVTPAPTFESPEGLIINNDKANIKTDKELETESNASMEQGAPPTPQSVAQGKAVYGNLYDDLYLSNKDIKLKDEKGNSVYKADMYDPNTLSYYLANKDNVSKDIFKKVINKEKITDKEKEIYKAYKEEWQILQRSKGIVNPVVVAFPNQKGIQDVYGIQVNKNGTEDGTSTYSYYYPDMAFVGVVDGNFKDGDKVIADKYSAKEFNKTFGGNVNGTNWTSGLVSYNKGVIREYLRYGANNSVKGAYIVNTMQFDEPTQNGVRVASMAARDKSKIDKIDLDAIIDKSGESPNIFVTPSGYAIPIDKKDAYNKNQITNKDIIGKGIPINLAQMGNDNRYHPVPCLAFYEKGGTQIQIYSYNGKEYVKQSHTFTPEEVEINVRPLMGTGNPNLDPQFTTQGDRNTKPDQKVWTQAINNIFNSSNTESNIDVNNTVNQ